MSSSVHRTENDSDAVVRTNATDHRHDRIPRRSAAWEHLDWLADKLYRRGWPAEAAYRLGFQRRVELMEHDLTLKGAVSNAPPLRIAFASDFHAGPFTHPSLLQSACSLLRAQKPDLLLLGGDFVSVHHRYAHDLARQLGKIEAPLGRYAVLGNHDIWAGGKLVAEELAKHGIRTLVNANVPLPEPYSHIHVCGIDDHIAGYPDATATFAEAHGIRLLLMHAPSCLLDLNGQSFDLALCGHTHGGQISLPGGKPILLPKGKLSRRYARGEHLLCDISGRSMLVSLGIGCSMVPIRMFCPSEVHLLRLRLHGSNE